MDETTVSIITRLRYLAGLRDGGSISNAGVNLVLPDRRELSPVTIMAADLAALGLMGNGIARLLGWMLQEGIITHVMVEARDGLMGAVLLLPNGQSNPGLALLNRLRTRLGQKVLQGNGLTRQAGLGRDDTSHYPDDKTPQGCRLADMLETLLLIAFNGALDQDSILQP